MSRAKTSAGLIPAYNLLAINTLCLFFVFQKNNRIFSQFA
jgi:hypothetical protein